MSVPMMRVSELAEQVRGVTYDKADASDAALPGYLPILRAGNITEFGLHFDDLVYVPASRVADRQRIRQGDVVIAASSGSLDVVGKAARVESAFAGSFGAFCKVLRPGPLVESAYFAHFFRTKDYRERISALAAGININNLRSGDLDGLEIHLPPLPEQRRIAAILDQADVLRAKRREALAKLDELTQAIFLEMFGDPATNPKGWPLRPLGELALKFSDGPFGSNLKSEHYAESGVRVVRLQNIGVGRFLDDDRVFISDSHFATLRKHECIPGDLLIGTLGDPNLRAAILPAHVTRALNKADCVQMRPDPTAATADYLCGLLNLPAVEGMARSLVLGQTRLRISMGRLRGLRVPVPPVKLQLVFTARLQSVRQIEGAARASDDHLGTLFASLQHRAFRGEL